MTTARTFRMTIATKWYDEREECVQEYEVGHSLREAA